MRRSALLIALAVITASCSAAEAELARMQEVPVIVEVDANGDDIVAYDPAETTPVETTTDASEIDLFDEQNDTTDEQAGGSNTTAPPTPADATTTTEPEPGIPVIEPTIIERYPHDGAAFTQGLAFADGVLIESTGLLGESARRRVAPATGEVISSARLDADLFGAGLAVTDGQIIQLTWQQGVAVVADLTTMLELSRFTYDGEGWGLCQLDSGSLVMSNGSGFLTLRDVATFEVTGEIEVTIDGEPTENLNELECVGGSIYANVWLENNILEIDAASGDVGRIIDASSLVPGDLAADDVLNGIAYRAESDTFFLTGKRWTVMYEVSLG